MEPFTFPPPNPRCRVLKLQDMVAHAEAVNSCSLGRKSAAVLATGGDDLRVHCWKVGKSTPLLSLSGHSTEVDSCCFDLREELICGGSRGGSIKLWDCGTARLLRSLSGHRAAVSALDFHPFGDFFASGSADCNVKVWDIKKKGCMQTYRGHAAHVTHCLHSPDGRWIVSGDADGAVKVWDLTAGRLVHEMRTARREPVTSLAFHPAEFLLAVASSHSIGFWDMELFSLLCQSPLSAAPIRQVCFDRDGAALLSLQADSLRVWGWEPLLCHDSVDVQWGATADVSISPNRELIVACKQRSAVSLHLLDLPLLAPYATAGDEENVTPAGAADGAEDAWKKGKQEHLMPAAMQPSQQPPASPSPPPPAAAGADIAAAEAEHPRLSQRRVLPCPCQCLARRRAGCQGRDLLLSSSHHQ